MKKTILICLLLVNYAYAQVASFSTAAKVPIPEKGLKMASTYGSSNTEMLEWMRFEDTDYFNIKFTGTELRTKAFTITVKEIWGGKIKSESIVVTSKELKNMGLDKINDTVLNMQVLGKQCENKKLKISFIFPRFSTTKTYRASSSTDYSLRNLANEGKLDIGYGKQFNFLAYILPYERKDGSKSWCDVGGSGKDVENWGKKFGIKHYLLFQLTFD